jgi:hypothetical protein
MYLLSSVKREARLRPTQIWLRTAGSVHVALSRLISDQRMPPISPRLAPVNMSSLTHLPYSSRSRQSATKRKVRKQLAKGVGILKVAKSLGIGIAVQRIANET